MPDDRLMPGLDPGQTLRYLDTLWCIAKPDDTGVLKNTQGRSAREAWACVENTRGPESARALRRQGYKARQVEVWRLLPRERRLIIEEDGLSPEAAKLSQLPRRGIGSIGGAVKWTIVDRPAVADEQLEHLPRLPSTINHIEHVAPWYRHMYESRGPRLGERLDIRRAYARWTTTGLLPA